MQARTKVRSEQVWSTRAMQLASGAVAIRVRKMRHPEYGDSLDLEKLVRRSATDEDGREIRAYVYDRAMGVRGVDEAELAHALHALADELLSGSGSDPLEARNGDSEGEALSPNAQAAKERRAAKLAKLVV